MAMVSNKLSGCRHSDCRRHFLLVGLAPLAFGVSLIAWSAATLAEPMSRKALDEVGGASAPVSLEATEPAAGDLEGASSLAALPMRSDNAWTLPIVPTIAVEAVPLSAEPHGEVDGQQVAEARGIDVPVPHDWGDAGDDEESADAPPVVTLPPTMLVGPGDTLQILVWRQPELSTSALVRPDGRISIPLVEDLYVAEKTYQEVADELERRLSTFVLDPQVTVTLASGLGSLSQQIRVLGETTRPTSVAFRAGISLLDVITEAGGLSPFAAGNDAVVLRREDGVWKEIPVRLSDLVRDGEIGANMAMLPGDVLIIPEGFFVGTWRQFESASTSMTITDNVDLEPDDDKKAAVINELTYTRNIRGTTARFSAALNSRTTLRRDSSDENIDLDSTLAGTATAELLPDHVFVDFNVSLSQERDDNEERSSVSSANLLNRDTVANIQISPYLRNRIGRYAQSELRYRGRQFLTSSENSSNSTLQQLSAALSSGPEFNTVRWAVNASTSLDSRSDSDDVRRTDVTSSVIYSVSRTVGLLGTLGYQVFDDGNSSNDINEPIWSIGANYRSARGSGAQLTYGQQDGQQSFAGTATYVVSSRTSVRASYNETLQTSQERITRDLILLEVSPTGVLIDSRTGLPFDPNTSPFRIDDRTTRTRQFTVSATHARGRDSINAIASIQRQEEEGAAGAGQNDEDARFAFTWNRTLNRNASLSTTGTVSRSELDRNPDRTDTTVTLRSRLSYRLFQNLSANVQYGFQNRFSTDDDEEFTENVVTVGVQARF